MKTSWRIFAGGRPGLRFRERYRLRQSRGHGGLHPVRLANLAGGGGLVVARRGLGGVAAPRGGPPRALGQPRGGRGADRRQRRLRVAAGAGLGDGGLGTRHDRRRGPTGRPSYGPVGGRGQGGPGSGGGDRRAGGGMGGPAHARRRGPMGRPSYGPVGGRGQEAPGSAGEDRRAVARMGATLRLADRRACDLRSRVRALLARFGRLKEPSPQPGGGPSTGASDPLRPPATSYELPRTPLRRSSE